MKIIKIIMATTADELKNERKELGDYIRMLNDHYHNKGIYFRLKNLLDIETEEEKNQELCDSEFFYIIFSDEADDGIVKKFDVALKHFKEKDSPRIYTYFQKLPDRDDTSDSIKWFMEKLDKEIGHYYSIFVNLDSIKLNMLLEITRTQALNDTLSVRNGQALLDGEEVLSLANVPVFKMNKTVKRLIEEREILQKELEHLKMHSSTNGNSLSVRDNVSATVGKIETINAQLQQMEKDMLSICAKVIEHISSGKPLTQSQKSASKCLDEGDYEGAKQNFDKQLGEAFDKFFSSKKDKGGDGKSALVEKIEKVKGERFVSEITKFSLINQQISTTFDNNISLFHEEIKDKHFSLFNPSGIKTLIFNLFLKKDFKTFKKFYVCEQLDCVEKKVSDGEGTIATFYFGSFFDNNNNENAELCFLHFDTINHEVKVNVGVLERGQIRISKKPMNMKFSDLDVVCFDKDMQLNNAAFNTEKLAEEKMKSAHDMTASWEDAQFSDDVSIIVDPETAEPVKREVYYDEVKHEWKAKILIQPYKHYFAFDIRSNDGAKHIPLTNIEIGECYHNGLFNFPKDILKAVEYYEKDGSGEAYYCIAKIFHTEEDLKDETAYEEYLEKSVEMGFEAALFERTVNLINADNEKNNNEIQFLLKKLVNIKSGLGFFIKGCLLEFGFKECNAREAFKCYYQSAEYSYEPALARLCLKDKNIDKAVAFEYFNSNLVYGKTIAIYCVACIYYFGIAVLQDKTEGLKLLLKATEMGNRTAALTLFNIYDSDIELKNQEKALKWLKKAEKYDSYLTVELANRLLDGNGCEVCEENDKLAFNLLQKACSNNDVTALNNLGWLLKNGRGCTVDYEKAHKLFEEAAKSGKASSLYHLGDMYENGLGVPKSFETAIDYYQRAAEKGNVKAKNKLKELKQ